MSKTKQKTENVINGCVKLQDNFSQSKYIVKKFSVNFCVFSVALCVISCLKTVLYPFLPSSSQKLHKLLGFESDAEADGWQPYFPPPGQRTYETQAFIL
jgi:methionyl-tRNA synthetase